MGGADTTAGVAVEVFVKGQQIAPVRVGLEEADITEDRAAAVLLVEEDRNQAAGEGPVKYLFIRTNHDTRA
jgi:hypothetical protein